MMSIIGKQGLWLMHIFFCSNASIYVYFGHDLHFILSILKFVHKEFNL